MARRLEEDKAESASGEAVIRAAGGVVGRQGEDGLEVLVVHRPQYDDWSLPKGKCLTDETDEECALREVAEETGLVCELGDELPATVYRDAKGRMKRARYWSMIPRAGELSFEHEVDTGRWLPVAEAKAILTYERDVVVVAALEQVYG
jgi:8-oxo-dGTP diphosphatase